MSHKIAPPGKHLSTSFRFAGGWHVEFHKKHGRGYSLTLIKTYQRPDGTFDQLQFIFPPDKGDENLPTQSNAKAFCERAILQLRGDLSGIDRTGTENTQDDGEVVVRPGDGREAPEE